MSRWSRLMPVAAVTVLLAACGQGGTDTPLSAPAPRYDGGLLVGGNYTDPGTGSGGTTTSGTTSSTSTTDVQSDSTAKDGGLLVGGN